MRRGKGKRKRQGYNRSEHAPQRHTQRAGRYKLVVNQSSKQHPCDTKLLLGVLVEEPVLVEQVVNHARKDFTLTSDAAILKLPKHFNDFVDALLGGVNLLEVTVGLFLNLLLGATKTKKHSSS